MAVVTTTFGNPVALAVTALHSLAGNAFWKSAAVNFTTNDPVFVTVQVKLVSSTTPGSATGYTNIYMACSDDNTVWDGNLSPSDAAWTSSAPSTAELSKCFQFLGRISMNTTSATSMTYVKTFFIPPASIPKYGAFVVENQRGATFAASGNTFEYTECGFTIT